MTTNSEKNWRMHKKTGDVFSIVRGLEIGAKWWSHQQETEDLTRVQENVYCIKPVTCRKKTLSFAYVQKGEEGL